MQVFNEVVLNFWFWFGCAVLFGIFEVLLGAAFFLLWLGLSAAAVGIIVWMVPTLHWHYQTIIFSLGAVSSIAFWRHHLKTQPLKKTGSSTLNRRADQYVGRSFTLIEPMVNGRGRVAVDDSTWQVVGPDLTAGTQVVVVGVDGVLLKVEAKNP